MAAITQPLARHCHDAVVASPASSTASVKKLVREARFQLRVRKDPVRALEFVTAADPMLADLDADAAQHASEGLAIYARGVEPNYPQLARIRTDLAPILKHASGR